MPEAEPPSWRDKFAPQTIALLKLDDGKTLTVEILKYSDDRTELEVEVISPPLPSASSIPLTIPVRCIVSLEGQPRAAQRWPYSDPGRGAFSLRRGVFTATLFLGIIIGSVLAFIFLMDRPYGLQEASAIFYTMFAAFYTFTATKFCPFRFTCPAVRPQITRLLLRHAGFLAVLLALETAAIAIRPTVPAWWTTGSRPPFDFALPFLLSALLQTQVYLNRSVLERAHREFSG